MNFPQMWHFLRLTVFELTLLFDFSVDQLGCTAVSFLYDGAGILGKLRAEVTQHHILKLLIGEAYFCLRCWFTGSTVNNNKQNRQKKRVQKMRETCLLG
jgi:hypothetical protein